jgi:hypothetical protein
MYKPEIKIFKFNSSLLTSSHKWNDVGNFGPGDRDDDDREGDDNWDKDWNWDD